MAEHNPHVRAVGFGPAGRPRQTAALDEVRVVSHVDELSPRPQRMVLAVAAPDLLERSRMLPVVVDTKQLRIGDVLAADEPLLNVVNARRRNTTCTVEVPGKVVD